MKSRVWTFRPGCQLSALLRARRPQNPGSPRPQCSPLAPPSPAPRPPNPFPVTRSLRFPSIVAHHFAFIFLLALTESGSRRCAASLRSFPARFQTRVSPLYFCFCLPRLFPPPSSYSSAPCSFVFIPSLQPFRTTVSCSKLVPAIRWPSLFAAGLRRTTRSV